MSFRNAEAQRNDSERGVSLVEFVLAFPIVAMLIFGIVDFARYYAVTGVLRAGAEQAINRARKIPNFDVSYSGMDMGDANYVRYTQARDVVLNEAESIPLASLLTDEAHPSGATLKRITVTDNGLNSASAPTPPTVTRSAAVLRPGECADVNGHGQVCNGPVSTGLPVTQLLQTYPIRVVLFADIQPFLPFLGTMTARGEAYGQRENVPQGPVAGVVPEEEAFHGAPEAPLPPVLPSAGNKEPESVFVTCSADPITAIYNSMRIGGEDPRDFADVPASPLVFTPRSPRPVCNGPRLSPNKSL